MAAPVMLIGEGTGRVYAATAGVTASDANEVGEFAGPVWLQLHFRGVERREQERFTTGILYPMGLAVITFAEMAFSLSQLELLWGISSNASDTLADGSTAATSYTIAQGTSPQALEVLFQMTDRDTGKKVEVFSSKAYCPILDIGLPKHGLLKLPDVVWHLVSSSSNIVKVSKEN